MSVTKDEKSSARDNMLKDLALFGSCAAPSVRIYGWERPSVTVGHSLTVADEIDLEKAAELGIDVEQRPTGGGIAFHTTEDVTYCIAAPLGPQSKSLMDSYLDISAVLLAALKDLGVDADLPAAKSGCGLHATFSSMCFASPMEYEITVSGRKLAGSAQKRTRDRLLQQGTVSIKKTPEYFFGLLKKPFDREAYYRSAVSFEELSCSKAAFNEVSARVFDRFLSSGLQL